VPRAVEADAAEIGDLCAPVRGIVEQYEKERGLYPEKKASVISEALVAIGKASVVKLGAATAQTNVEEARG